MADTAKADTEKITIVLADEDALRRDGLAAVLDGNERFRVISQCADGETALERIREFCPDIAVVDLNLPKLHGIELVRRVRQEELGTKVVILSGSADDDIVREVIRAGGDGYLLKNGPARHLIDAISYVQDGGQYFSPQLRRDGLDRRLLEEKPRPRPEARRIARGPEAEDPESDVENDAAGDDSADHERQGRAAREPRSGRGRRTGRRGIDPQRLRERLREEGTSTNLQDRDYEVLSMMADGIRPILDRLDEIEGRVVEMETGDAPVPHDPRGWINSEMANTFGGPRQSGMGAGRTVQDLESRIPRMIEEAVTARFHHMAEKLQQEIEETHIRTLETFVKNIQVKLVQRVSRLEVDMSKQAEAMHQLREYTQRTEDNLTRLLTGVDKLAQELPKRLAAPDSDAEAASPAKRIKRGRSRKTPVKLFSALLAVVVLVALGFAFVPKTNKAKSAGAASSAPSGSLDSPPENSASLTSTVSAAPGSSSSDKPAGDSAAPNPEVEKKLQAAAKYSDQKEYTTAEDIYRQILKADPNNIDALKGLASVLYREDKIEESTAILDKMPKN